MTDPISDLERRTRTSYTLSVAVESYCHDRLAPLEAHIIKTYLPRPGCILELGCGAGRLTGHLMGAGKFIMASDISHPMVARARQRCPDVLLQCADACALPYRSGTFDAVLFGFNGLDCLLPLSRRRECLLASLGFTDIQRELPYHCFSGRSSAGVIDGDGSRQISLLGRQSITRCALSRVRADR